MDTDPDSGAQANEKWYALRVETRAGWLSANAARHKVFEACVRVVRCTSRAQPVDVSLFGAYAFCRVNPVFLLLLLTIAVVPHLVGVRDVPVAIDDAQIAVTQIATQSGLSYGALAVTRLGKSVQLQTGPLGWLRSESGRLVPKVGRFHVEAS